VGLEQGQQYINVSWQQSKSSSIEQVRDDVLGKHTTGSASRMLACTHNNHALALRHGVLYW
jgi:hypothetical protein